MKKKKTMLKNWKKICINKACEYRNDSPGNGSIISIYRKYNIK